MAELNQTNETAVKIAMENEDLAMTPVYHVFNIWVIHDFKKINQSIFTTNADSEVA